MHLKRIVVMIGSVFFLFFFTCIRHVSASEQDEIDQQRLELYKKTEAATQIPWYYLAAIDQYERNIRAVRKDLPKPESLIGIYIAPETWSGKLNPIADDTNPSRIRFFDGLGVDGNGDGRADRNDDEDVLYAIAHYLQQYGPREDFLRIGLWEYYNRDKTVSMISGFARLYKQYQTLKLDEKHFPLPLHVNYSYRSTWGHARGWGGRRIHEGTDIFSGYGVTVYSTCYGIVEMKGWNRYGGWRIGIRDLNNTYHYFAHLNGFADGLQVGDLVEPGQPIGYVGSTGYGPPGTAGKFPPHLHYGMYKDDGRTEWSFDPYPHLKRWERETRKKHVQ